MDNAEWRLPAFDDAEYSNFFDFLQQYKHKYEKAPSQKASRKPFRLGF